MQKTWIVTLILVLAAVGVTAVVTNSINTKSRNNAVIEQKHTDAMMAEQAAMHASVSPSPSVSPTPDTMMKH
jgi:hypothetical protein